MTAGDQPSTSRQCLYRSGVIKTGSISIAMLHNVEGEGQGRKPLLFRLRSRVRHGIGRVDSLGGDLLALPRRGRLALVGVHPIHRGLRLAGRGEDRPLVVLQRL